MSDLINKSYFIDTLTNKHDIKATDAKKLVNTFFDVVTGALSKGESIRIGGVGTLYSKFKQGGRPVRNPKTMEEFIMPDTYGFRLVTTSPTGIKPLFGYELINRMIKCEPLEGVYINDMVITLWRELRFVLGQGWDFQVRGLGTIKQGSTVRPVRNPKTGEALGDKLVSWYTFKPSPKLLTRRLACK